MKEETLADKYAPEADKDKEESKDKIIISNEAFLLSSLLEKLNTLMRGRGL